MEKMIVREESRSIVDSGMPNSFERTKVAIADTVNFLTIKYVKIATFTIWVTEGKFKDGLLCIDQNRYD
jgi:mannitol-1-phosphate/altronate dehydrogenase